MIYLKYLKYILIHKWYVFCECYKYGLIWIGITHDCSKLLPSEFTAYAKYFYGKNNKDVEIHQKFKVAWLHHQNRNQHHWQYWILKNDSGEVEIFPMPEKVWKELVCDWRGAGKAITGEDNIINWYEQNKNKIILNEQTRKNIESEIYGRR